MDEAEVGRDRERDGWEDIWVRRVPLAVRWERKSGWIWRDEDAMWDEMERS